MQRIDENTSFIENRQADKTQILFSIYLLMEKIYGRVSPYTSCIIQTRAVEPEVHAPNKLKDTGLYKTVTLGQDTKMVQSKAISPM